MIGKGEEQKPPEGKDLSDLLAALGSFFKFTPRNLYLLFFLIVIIIVVLLLFLKKKKKNKKED